MLDPWASGWLGCGPVGVTIGPLDGKIGGDFDTKFVEFGDAMKFFEKFSRQIEMGTSPFVAMMLDGLLDPWVARWLGSGPVGGTMLAISDMLSMRKSVEFRRDVRFGIDWLDSVCLRSVLGVHRDPRGRGHHCGGP